MKVNGIYTIRDVSHPYYWDIIYEWEDIFSQVFDAPLIPVGKDYDEIYRPSFFRKILNRINYYQIRDRYFLQPTDYYLAFHIGPPGVYSFHSRMNVIPIIIDFWGTENTQRFEKIFYKSPAVVVSSKQVYNYLKSKRINLNLLHLPLSLPDKYMLRNLGSDREIDVVQMGRQNSQLAQFMEQLMKEHPEIHYVWAENRGGVFYMISNKNGNLGKFSDRESFMGLLRRSKVSLLSAPGVDQDFSRTGGFSPVTPRFLESAACGCHLIGIYPNNDDFNEYGISDFCKTFQTYHEFRNLILESLDSKHPATNHSFLQNHLTSKRAGELKQQLESL